MSLLCAFGKDLIRSISWRPCTALTRCLLYEGGSQWNYCSLCNFSTECFKLFQNPTFKIKTFWIHKVLVKLSKAQKVGVKNGRLYYQSFITRNQSEISWALGASCWIKCSQNTSYVVSKQLHRSECVCTPSTSVLMLPLTYKIYMEYQNKSKCLGFAPLHPQLLRCS